MIDINALINEGAPDDVILEAIAKNKAEKAAIEEQERKEEAAKRAQDEKEALKAEARAYIINALVAYAEAFDLVDEDGFSEEEIAKYEEVIKSYETMIPMMIKLAEMQDDIDKDLFDFGFRM